MARSEDTGPPSLREVAEIRHRMQHGELVGQREIDSVVEYLRPWRNVFRATEKDESLVLVAESGKSMGTSAPRWACHLLALRHTSVHVLVRLVSLDLGNVYLLQVRSWDKVDSPGHIDISVGGHVVGDVGSNVVGTAYQEMSEELGIGRSDLTTRELIPVIGYSFTETREHDCFYNTEWREVYIADLPLEGLQHIRFTDKEVVGLYLCPESEAQGLLSQERIPLASALKQSLPRCIGK